MTDRPDPMQIEAGPLTEEQRIYKENILEHYRRPRNRRIIDHPTVLLRDTNPFCGDAIEAFVTIEDGRIEDVAFQGQGCAISQAAMSMVTQRLKGMRTDDALKLGQEDVLAMLGIPIGIVRRKCALLGLRTVQKAIAGVNNG